MLLVKKVTLITVFGALVAGVLASSALASPPTTFSLTGEHFVGPTTNRDVHCNADGTGYVTFSTSGSASGPYNGTFQESGVLAIVKYNGLLYENFVAGFRIDSTAPQAVIYGGKAEIPPETFPPPPGATCQIYAQPGFGYSTIGNSAPNRYRAFIAANGETYQDKGSTDVLFLPVGPGPGAFQETFVSDNGLTLSPSDQG